MALKRVQWHQHTIDISYEIVNPDAKVDMIVLHGWGSSKTLMKEAFSHHLDTFRHIYIDLPGFGNSTASAVMDTHDYREIIATFLEEISASRDIIMGHSFGGKIATLLNPDRLVLLSSAGIVEPKPLTVWLKIYTFKFLKLLGLTQLRKLFVASDAKDLDKFMYGTFKKVINEDFSAIFKNFRHLALIFWGDKDEATHVSSGERIHELISNSRFYVYDGDHYFFLHHTKEICDVIEESFTSMKEA